MKKLKEFYHYGIKVETRISKDGAERDLQQSGIKYTELPLVENKVLRFYKDGKKYYAYCVSTEIDEEPYERVFITSQIPEDMCWRNIIDDYNQQCDKKVPMQLRTRARVLYDKAKQMVRENPIKEPENFLEWAELPKKKDIEVALLSLGVSWDELKNMDHHDVPELDE